MLNLLWISDKIMGGFSAYTKITYETCTRLADRGYNVAHIPMGEANKMGKQVIDNVMVYPSGRYGGWGEDVAVGDYVDWDADLLITLKEPWVFNSIHKVGINWVPFAIIDHEPVSIYITSRLHQAFKVIAITRFGQRELRDHDIDSVYIPHSVDTEVFHPIPGKKKECRDLFFLDEEEYVVTVIALNRARKMIPRMIRGYKLFRDRNPDVKSTLFLWTEMTPKPLREKTVPVGIADVGVNLVPEVLDLDMGDMVQWIKKEQEQTGIWSEISEAGGIPDSHPDPNVPTMNKLYNASDVLLLCSGGEAFGLPLVEAQAAGTPVVTTSYAGGPEQVGCGVTVPWNDYVIYDTMGVRRPLADLDKMADALEKIMNRDPQKMSRKARRFAMRYGYDRVIERYWKPFLEDCRSELYPKYTEEGITTWA